MWPGEAPKTEVIGRQGAIPLLSLDGVCPCRMCSLLVGASDLALWLMLRTAGHGIQKASIARRVAIRLRSIGFERSARLLTERFGRRRGRGRGLPSGQQLVFRMPGVSSSACDAGNGERSFSPEASVVLTDYVPERGIGSRAFHVGDN